MVTITQPFAPTKTPITDEQGYVTDLWSAFFDRLQQIANPSPIGCIIEYAGQTPPAGWLICDGRLVSISTYAELFLAIGNRYGPSDGVRTFTLPNMVGRIALGAASESELGSIGGSDGVTLTNDNLPELELTVNDPGHTHVFTGDPHHHAIPKGTTAAAGAYLAASNVAGTSDTSDTTAAGTNEDSETGITVTGGGTAAKIDTLPPYIKVNFIIKY